MPMHESQPRLDLPCEMINVVPINPLISKCQIKVCYVGDEPNRNGSVITKEVAREMANSLPGSPIVGTYNEKEQDFEEHNRAIEIVDGQFKITDLTRPYGFVDLGAKVWFQKFQEQEEVREYLMTEGWLWTGQYPECQRIIDQGNNQSMELDENHINAHWAELENNGPEFFIINEAIISKLCILGQDYEPCFEGAQITKVQFSLDDNFKQELYSMMKQLKEILIEGGVPVEQEVITSVEEEEVKFSKEEEEEKCPECGKPLDECTCEKEEDKKEKYNLNEIPEYTELVNNYNELQTRHSELETEVSELREFKASIEKKEKEAMIDSFYMLSDEDKADVVNNIDTYSLDDIEAKLSILCVRNKVSFDLEEDNRNNDVITYSINEENKDDDVPAWIKAVQNVVKEK